MSASLAEKSVLQKLQKLNDYAVKKISVQSIQNQYPALLALQVRNEAKEGSKAPESAVNDTELTQANQEIIDQRYETLSAMYQNLLDKFTNQSSLSEKVTESLFKCFDEFDQRLLKIKSYMKRNIKNIDLRIDQF